MLHSFGASDLGLCGLAAVQIQEPLLSTRPVPGSDTHASTLSPGTSRPTPSGVPVSTTSPSCSGKRAAMKSTSVGTGKIMLSVVERCLVWPFTVMPSSSLPRSTPCVLNAGPRGQAAWNDLARVQGNPFAFMAACTSRAVRSRATAALLGTPSGPTSTASSTSCCTSLLQCTGRGSSCGVSLASAANGASTLLPDLRKMRGSVGID
mmetsp:Transcript_16457/g.41035  ORF Transcript_16457/g.41035 Transcript_16457/m.41035 type:complete len:206 (-) Transcript_16457:295-912(-)